MSEEGLIQDFFPGGEGGAKYRFVQRVHVHVGAPARIFVDFPKILGTFKDKNRQIQL